MHKTQDLLYESTQDTLKLRREWQDNENRWQKEKDELLLELDKCRGRLNLDRQDHPDRSMTQAANISNNAALTIDSTAKYRLEAKVSFNISAVSISNLEFYGCICLQITNGVSSLHSLRPQTSGILSAIKKFDMNGFIAALYCFKVLISVINGDEL